MYLPGVSVCAYHNVNHGACVRMCHGVHGVWTGACVLLCVRVLAHICVLQVCARP